MKKIACISMLLLSVGFYACSDTSDGDVRSVPIDSTNANGTAPVQYHSNDTVPMLPDASQGSGNRVNTPGGDSAPAATHQQ